MLAVKCGEGSVLVWAVILAKSLHLMFAQPSNMRFLQDQVHDMFLKRLPHDIPIYQSDGASIKNSKCFQAFRIWFYKHQVEERTFPDLPLTKSEALMDIL